jgi:hypothetical protein
VERFVRKVAAAMIEKLELEHVNESIKKKVFFVFEKRDEGNKGRSKKPSKLNEAIRILAARIQCRMNDVSMITRSALQ